MLLLPGCKAGPVTGCSSCRQLRCFFLILSYCCTTTLVVVCVLQLPLFCMAYSRQLCNSVMPGPPKTSSL